MLWPTPGMVLEPCLCGRIAVHTCVVTLQYFPHKILACHTLTSPTGGPARPVHQIDKRLTHTHTHTGDVHAGEMSHRALGGDAQGSAPLLLTST